jgi:peroxiredoxin
LGQLQGIVPELKELGYRIVAVSPDRPEKLAASLKKNQLDYLLLSDSRMEAARAFGLAHQLDDAAVEKFKEYGIDLEADSGQEHHQLPVPAVFVVGTSGRIEFHYVHPNYQVRVDPDVLLAAARASAK